MTNGNAPQGMPQAGSDCEHEWFEFVIYDARANQEIRYLECRLCGVNAGENVNTRIHGSRYINLENPIANTDWDYKKPMGYIGTGINTWYPTED